MGLKVILIIDIPKVEMWIFFKVTYVISMLIFDNLPVIYFIRSCEYSKINILNKEIKDNDNYCSRMIQISMIIDRLVGSLL